MSSGKAIKFSLNGVEVSGYLAGESLIGKAPVIIVIHEWWGLVNHIKNVCDRFVDEGFIAFGIDLYKGKTTTNPDEAGSLMQDLFQNRFEEAKKIVQATIEYFKNQRIGFVEPQQKLKIGMTGYCCGGTCTWAFASLFSDIFYAIAPYYGLYKLVPIDFSKIKAPVLAVHAGKDAFIPLSEVMEAIEKCNQNQIHSQFLIYPGVDHAFFNDARPEVYHKDYAMDVWKKTVDFFKTK